MHCCDHLQLALGDRPSGWRPALMTDLEHDVMVCIAEWAAPGDFPNLRLVCRGFRDASYDAAVALRPAKTATADVLSTICAAFRKACALDASSCQQLTNDSLAALPPSLTRLDLSSCFWLTGAGFAPLAGLGSLRILVLDWSLGLASLPESVGALTALESLSMRYCNALTGLPDTLSTLRMLRFLDLENCTALQELPG